MKLYICETPSQAKDIAMVIGAIEKKNGYFEGENNVVTWGFGHLLALANPDYYDEKYISWSLDTLPIVPESFKMIIEYDEAIKPPKSKINAKALENLKLKKKQLTIISKLIKKADSIVISTDADREGEAIARTILDYYNWEGETERLWLSALDEQSIKKALDNVLAGEETENLYQAALGRAQADWITGMNLTRAYTTTSNGEGVLSVGRVQTPTLNLIVSRDKQIESFKSIDHYTLKASFKEGEMQCNATLKPNDKFTNEDNLIIDKKIIEAINQKVDGQEGELTTYKTERKKQSAPLPFDLSELQKELSKKYGIGAKDTLDIAQSLYETHKATTYPRTDCQFLPESQLSEVDEVKNALLENPSFLPDLLKNADFSIKSKVWNDKKISAHHAIIPTKTKANISKMSKEELLAYELIVSRYLLQFYPVYEYDQTTIEIVVNDQLFSVVGKTPVIQGWKMNTKTEDEKEEDDQTLPSLTQGQTLLCYKTQIQTKKTIPPKRFTEGTLIQGMKSIGKDITDPEYKKILKETSGIGTEATRANIIETLFNRNYIEKEGKKNLISTKLGRDLIDALPDEVKNPATTAIWEQALDQVAKGERTLSDFMEKQSAWIHTMIDGIKDGGMVVKQEIKHKCPECSSALIRRKGKNGFFWGCSNYPKCKTIMSDSKGKPEKSKAFDR